MPAAATMSAVLPSPDSPMPSTLLDSNITAMLLSNGASNAYRPGSFATQLEFLSEFLETRYGQVCMSQTCVVRGQITRLVHACFLLLLCHFVVAACTRRVAAISI